jgi:hypothetical protein
VIWSCSVVPVSVQEKLVRIASRVNTHIHVPIHYTNKIEEKESMSTQRPPSPPPPKLDFAPLHRTAELENIHAQVTQNDSKQQKEQSPSTRKVLVKYMTVIGDGSDIDNSQITSQQ